MTYLSDKFLNEFCFITVKPSLLDRMGCDEVLAGRLKSLAEGADVILATDKALGAVRPSLDALAMPVRRIRDFVTAAMFKSCKFVRQNVVKSAALFSIATMDALLKLEQLMSSY